jgi:hypothetical protein
MIFDLIRKEKNNINWLGFSLDTDDDEYHRNHTQLTIYGFKNIRRYKVNLDWKWLKSTTVRSLGNTYDIKIQKEWLAVYTKRTKDENPSFYIVWGITNDLWEIKHIEPKLKLAKTIFIHFPWLERTFKKRELLNLDGTVFKNIRDAEPADADQPTVSYFIIDGYDDKILQVKCRLTKTTFTRGTGLFSWLKYIYPIEEYIYVEMEFSDELGEGKDTWKGGVLGTSTLLKNNGINKTVQAFCEKEGHTYIGLNY